MVSFPGTKFLLNSVIFALLAGNQGMDELLRISNKLLYVACVFA